MAQLTVIFRDDTAYSSPSQECYIGLPYGLLSLASDITTCRDLTLTSPVHPGRKSENETPVPLFHLLSAGMFAVVVSIASAGLAPRPLALIQAPSYQSLFMRVPDVDTAKLTTRKRQLTMVA